MSKEDKELDEMFHGEPKPLHPDTVYVTYGGQAKEEKKTVAKKDIPVESQWEPVKPSPNWLDKVKSCAKLTIPYGTLAMLVLYWNESGLMADSIAIPSMLVCACIAGLGVGKVVWE